MIYDIAIGEKKYRVELDRPNGGWSCRLNGRDIDSRRHARSGWSSFVARRRPQL